MDWLQAWLRTRKYQKVLRDVGPAHLVESSAPDIRLDINEQQRAYYENVSFARSAYALIVPLVDIQVSASSFESTYLPQSSAVNNDQAVDNYSLIVPPINQRYRKLT